MEYWTCSRRPAPRPADPRARARRSRRRRVGRAAAARRPRLAPRPRRRAHRATSRSCPHDAARPPPPAPPRRSRRCAPTRSPSPTPAAAAGRAVAGGRSRSPAACSPLVIGRRCCSPARAACSPAAPTAARSRGPGALGGVAGTGLTRAQRDRACAPAARTPGDALAAGRYQATSYGPPWGGIQGAGVSDQRRPAHRRRRAALVHGRRRPRADRPRHSSSTSGPTRSAGAGPFLAADTGGAIHGRRIDFYDWRGRSAQHAWGQRDVTVSRTADRHGGRALSWPRSGCAAARVDSADVGAAHRARSRAPSSAADRSIRGFTPPAVGYAWCAWFATNVWRQAGVPIPVNGWSGYPYTGRRPAASCSSASASRRPGATPPVGVGADVRHQPAARRRLAAHQPRRPRPARRDLHGHRRQPGRRPRHPLRPVPAAAHRPRPPHRARLRRPARSTASRPPPPRDPLGRHRRCSPPQRSPPPHSPRSAPTPIAAPIARPGSARARTSVRPHQRRRRPLSPSRRSSARTAPRAAGATPKAPRTTSGRCSPSSRSPVPA